MCTLMNIKTGGCSEDCSYCAQSSRYNTGLKATKMVTVESVLEAARIAKENGSSRFCMGAAWRDMRGRKTNLKNIKEMVKGVRALGMEACVTLGMIDAEQAKELKGAGLTAYNHNVDTSREHYPNVITTRSYDERLATIDNVRDAGINVCSGGILGLGEGEHDRVGLIYTVATMPSHPESFPVNALVPIKGTPLGDSEPVPFDSVVRTIATARLVMPTTIIRLAAGRITMSEEKQMLCFMSGANAIFTGEKMLTTDCNGWDEDKAMFERWGLRPMAAKDDSMPSSIETSKPASWEALKTETSSATAPA
jgi:biotin synthase